MRCLRCLHLFAAKACAVCDAEFFVDMDSRRRRLYCGKKCGRKASRERERQRKIAAAKAAA